MIISRKLANINGGVTNVKVHFQNILLLSNTKQRNIRIRIRFTQYLLNYLKKTKISGYCSSMKTMVIFVILLVRS
jgi:hypothetical protein